MYLQALWFMVFASVLASAWLAAGYATVLGEAKHAALRSAGLAVERAQDALVESIAAQVAAGKSTFVAPTPGPGVPICPRRSHQSDPCPFIVSTIVTLAGQTGARDGDGNQTAQSVQRDPGVGEQRVAAIVTAEVTGKRGTPIAALTRHVTLRTFAAWPYAALSGSDEPTTGGYAVGDFAGTCAGGACGDDNRIHAVLQCSDPGDPQACAGQPLLPADDFADARWHDANAVSNGWSR
jgi:hypothetical protein